jgi:spermidine synthase
MRPFHTLERVATPEGPLELRQRGDGDFLITISGRPLMTSRAHRSEDELARLACAALAGQGGPYKGLPARPRVLVGGLGMGYTLRAALDRLPPAAQVEVAELNPQVVAWCRGPLSALTAGAVADPRVKVEIADVARVIAAAPEGRYDAIVLDLYEGPHHAVNPVHDPLYGKQACDHYRAALRPSGVLCVWSEEADPPFEARLSAAGFHVERHKSKGGRVHVVYVATRAATRMDPKGPARPRE